MKINFPVKNTVLYKIFEFDCTNLMILLTFKTLLFHSTDTRRVVLIKKNILSAITSVKHSDAYSVCLTDKLVGRY